MPGLERLGRTSSPLPGGAKTWSDQTSPWPLAQATSADNDWGRAMSLPSFIGIGAQKCASTWIYDILRDHPQVRLSECKELDFFSYHYDRGYQWYERQFAGPDDADVVGEVSPSYFHEPAVPQRLKTYLPQAKVVVSLRDPVERALSHHRHAVRVGDIVGDDLSFESALASNPMYLEQGCYATHLKRWFDNYPKEQILILLYEDIANDPVETAHRIYRFLGVNSEHRSASLDKRSNVSHVTPYAALEKTRKALRGAVRSVGFGKAWEWSASLGVRRLYHQVNRRPSNEAIPPVAEGTIDELRSFFRDEIVQLEKLIGRQVAGWR